MSQVPSNPVPTGGRQPITPERVAATVGRYAIAFMRIALWTVLAFATGAVVFVIVRGIIWALMGVCEAIGV